jgi:hypothetical protein
MFAGGACLSAAQLLPAAEFASQSVRREWPFELFTLHSLHPLSLLTALFPFFHGEGRGIYRMPYWGVYWHQNEAQIYLGVIALSLAIAGAFFVWRARWGVGMFWVCVAVIGVVLALGKYAGPLASALYHVPVVGAFRSPNRHWMEVALGVAVLSGYAVDRLLGDKSLPLARAARIASLSLAAVCVAVGAFVLWRKDWAEAVVRTLSDLGSASPGVFRAAGPEFYLPMITSLCAMAVIMIFTRSRRRSQWFALLLAALIIDYHLYAVFAPIASPAGLETLVGTAMPRALAAKQSEREPIRYHILLDPASGEFDPCLFYGAEMVTGYDPVLSARYKTFSGVDEAGRSFIASLLDPQDQTLDLLNTRYVFAPSSMRFDQSRWREAGARSEAKAYRDFRILENLRPAPRAWLIARVKVAYEGDQLKLIRGELAGDSFDPRATALVDHETAATLNPSLLAASGEGEEGERKAEIIERSPTRMLIETDSPKAAILVLSEIAYPGWRATIDGIGAESLRVNYNLRGVALPEGRHRIEFVYSPASLKVGAVVSITTALGLLLIIFWDKRSAKVIRDADAV